MSRFRYTRDGTRRRDRQRTPLPPFTRRKSSPVPPVGPCFLTIPPPGSFPSMYDDESMAEAVLDNPGVVADCIGFLEAFAPGSSFSAAFSANTTTFAVAFDEESSGAGFWGAFSIPAGGKLTFTGSGWDTVRATIYDGDGNWIEDVGPEASPGPLESSTLPPGNYVFLIIVGSPPPFGTPSASGGATATCDTPVTPCPIRAAYDDGEGNPAYLICT